MELQLEYLLWLQEIRIATNSIFTPFFLFMTRFGEYIIPILACAVAYWCIDKKLGALIILNTALSLMITQLFKSCACLARPWILDNRITPVKEALKYAGGYSFPSGHSALAVSCWGSFAIWYKNNKKVVFSAIIICLLVAFSRNYLGVHTLQDILVGLVTSLIILIATYKTLNWCEQKKNRDLIFALTVSVLSTAIVAYTYYKNYPVIHDLSGKIISLPEHSKWSGFPKLGLIFGAFWGWYFERRYINFNPTQCCTKTKIKRSLCGIGLFIIIIFAVHPLLEQFPDKHCGRFLYMLLVGLFITFIYPLIITKTSLLNDSQSAAKK